MKRAAGFTLVSAIFLVVVLSALGVSLVTLSSVANTTGAQNLQAVRAGYAARAGIEWAVNMAATACPAGPTSLTLDGALAGFTVAVTCTQSTHSLPSNNVALASYSQLYYIVDVTATSGTYGNPDFVMRKAQAKVLGPTP